MTTLNLWVLSLTDELTSSVGTILNSNEISKSGDFVHMPVVLCKKNRDRINNFQENYIYPVVRFHECSIQIHLVAVFEVSIQKRL